MKTSFLVFALKNLQRNLKRNIATGSAIALGFTGILFLGGYANRLDNYLRVYTVYTLHTGHLTIFAKEGLNKFNLKPKTYSLNLNQQNKIENALRKRSENIEFYEKQLSGMGLVGNGCLSVPFVAHGIDPQVDQMIRTHPEVTKWMPDLKFFIKGKGLWNYDAQLNPISMSMGLAKALGKLKVHDEFEKQVVPLLDCKELRNRDKFSLDANVQMMSGKWKGSVGLIDGELVSLFTTGFEEGDNSSIQLNLNHLQNLYETDHVQQIAVWLKDLRQLPKIMEELNLELKDDSVDIHKWNDENLSPYYHGTTEFLYYLVYFIGVVLLIVIVFSVLNSVTMTVLERSQEIGMYRAIGFRKSDVNHLFLIESLWLTVLSLIMGGVLTFIFVNIIHFLKIIYYPPGVVGGIPIQISIDPKLIMISTVLILILSLSVTALSVQFRLKVKVANLVGGLFR